MKAARNLSGYSCMKRDEAPLRAILTGVLGWTAMQFAAWCAGFDSYAGDDNSMRWHADPEYWAANCIARRENPELRGLAMVRMCQRVEDALKAHVREHGYTNFDKLERG
jgi:hypothetical protein